MIEKICQPPDYCKTKTETFFARSRCLALVKLSKNLFDLICLDSDAGIGHFKTTLTVPLDARHSNFAFLRVTNRVGDQVANNLGEQVRITADDSIG